MAAYQGLSEPALKWNGQALAIMPNSLTFKKGKGEKTVRAVSAGGDAIEVVTTVNVETKKSMLKFSLPNTSRAMSIVAQMQSLDGRNVFELSDPTFQGTFRNMTVINDPENPTAPDGVIEVECEGPPAVTGGNT